MKFSETCASAVRQARETGCVLYVYETPSLWTVTAASQPGWLFKAFPGGFRMTSPAGMRLLEAENQPGERDQRLKMTDEANMTDSNPNQIEVVGCARCGGAHTLNFQRFDRPIVTSGNRLVGTHWALCPATGAPILMRQIETTEPDRVQRYLEDGVFWWIR